MSGTLFDPKTVETPTCKALGCQAGTRKNLCKWAADIAHGSIDPYTPKPKSCLHRIDPAEGRIPY